MKKVQALANLIKQKELKYADELFFCEGEFFAIHDGKIAKLPDFTNDFDGIYKIKNSTFGFITSYIVTNNLDADAIIDALSLYESDLNINGNEIPDMLDYDTYNFLISCNERSVSPYSAYMALQLIMLGVEGGAWYLKDFDGEYKNALEYISEACQVIDFHYTDEWDDEYWWQIIENLENYIFDGGEIF